jgi:hypothetical protein
MADDILRAGDRGGTPQVAAVDLAVPSDWGTGASGRSMCVRPLGRSLRITCFASPAGSICAAQGLHRRNLIRAMKSRGGCAHHKGSL